MIRSRSCERTYHRSSGEANVANVAFLPKLGSLVASSLLVLAAACGGADTGSTGSYPTAENGKPKNAADLAVNLVGGKVTTFVAIDRMRSHPVGPKILSLPMVADMLEGTGIDPLKDLERVFVTGPATNSPRLVTFAEHNLDAKAAHAALSSPSSRRATPPGQLVIPAQGYEAARVTIKDRTGVIAMLPPHFLVVVPEDLASPIPDFEASGGLADLTGPEAVRSTALDPGNTVKGSRVPDIPTTITKGTLTILLKPDGGADVDMVGDDANADSAISDAKALAVSVDKATSMKVMGMTLRAFAPIKFVSEGNEVKGHLGLSKDELEGIVNLAPSLAQ